MSQTLYTSKKRELLAYSGYGGDLFLISTYVARNVVSVSQTQQTIFANRFLF